IPGTIMPTARARRSGRSAGRTPTCASRASRHGCGSWAARIPDATGRGRLECPGTRVSPQGPIEEPAPEIHGVGGALGRVVPGVDELLEQTEETDPGGHTTAALGVPEVRQEHRGWRTGIGPGLVPGHGADETGETEALSLYRAEEIVAELA